jgi:hypothetical protein
VDITNTCLSVQNCGTDGVLNVSGAITVEGIAVTVANPFPVDLRNACLSVQNCEGSILDVNITNTCLSVQNCGADGVLNVSGNITVEGIAVTVANPFPVDLRNTCLSVQNCEGTILDVNITNTCLSVQNCGEGSLSVTGTVQIQHGDFPVGLSNPLTTQVLGCVSVQNCEGTELNVSGNITVDGVAVSVANPFPVDLRNACLSVQNCEGTFLDIKITDGTNNVGLLLNDNDGQTANTYSLPVENFNMIWNGETWDRMPGNAISGVLVNISNSCLSVANCANSVLAVAGDVNVLIGGADVSADNPIPVRIPDCVSVQNCGEGSLSINGQVELTLAAQTVSDSNPLPVTGTFALGGTNLDAFARLRVSNPFTLFDGALRYRDDPFKWSESTSGNGVITFNADRSTITMGVVGAGTCVRESKRVFSYQPGKSLLTMASFVMHTPTVGVRQRVGFFGAENGVYFEVNDLVKNMVIRKYTSGSVDDTTEKVPQSSWNGDRLDGTGSSGITLSVAKSQIWWCDIEWLGVGSVRTGFIINGEFIVCHTFHHANLLALVYMTTATLPVRYELTVTGENTASMQAICSAVISEGGYVNRSLPRSVGTGLTGQNLSNTVYRPLVSIRLKSTNLDAVVVPSKFDVLGIQNAAFGYRIILNPTLSGASFISAGTNSSVEYDITATGLTGGTVIDEGVFQGTNKGASVSVTSTEVDFSQQLGRTLSGVSDIWCLAAIASTNNDDAVGVVSWQEHA